MCRPAEHRSSPVAVPVGERVVAYFDHIGGIEGEAVREFDWRLRIKIHATKHKREKLAAQLTWLANRRAGAGGRARHSASHRPKAILAAAGGGHHAVLPGA
jgi:hypothetical protein